MARTWMQNLRLRIARWARGPSLGHRGEIAAERYLRQLGYRTLHRNYKLHGGELDRVMVDGRTVVFVEVKTRVSQELARPEHAVDAAKRQQLIRVAGAYVRRYHLQDCSIRYDIVAVLWPPDERKPEIRHWPGAFYE